MIIKRPLKAPSEAVSDAYLQAYKKYPLIGSPKLDGFRATKYGAVHTSSMKLFNNEFVQRQLADCYDGLDGEILIGDPRKGSDSFHDTSGALRRGDGEPDFRFYVFDQFVDKTKDYYSRWLDCAQHMELHPRVVLLEWKVLNSFEEVRAYEAECLDAGYEGIMLRSPEGRYKEGRATILEDIIWKRKPFVETEGRIIGFVEGTTNNNPEEINELGLTRRSKHKENMIPNGTLGAFEVVCPLFSEPFSLGCGKMTHDKAQEVWDNRFNPDYELSLGKWVTFKYQKHGSTDENPRLPIFLRSRPDFDIAPEV